MFKNIILNDLRDLINVKKKDNWNGLMKSCRANITIVSHHLHRTTPGVTNVDPVAL